MRVKEGSSPLTRGKPLIGCRGGGGFGLIPAHAGKTWLHPPHRWTHQAHPRSRGENPMTPGLATVEWGSSPLTRGKPDRGGSPADLRRLIPAHAGKTSSRCGMRSARRAHPRSRGENVSETRAQRHGRGSSPLTRGKPWGWCRGGAGSGLIPAHAGKTCLASGVRLYSGAHPRSRGENGKSSRGAHAPLGSSPLTRGKLIHEGIEIVTDGLIPAHAGKTSWRRRRFPRLGAHPRSRGENEGVTLHQLRHRGSSPLTRGKPPSPAIFGPPIGLIPAHAGKTGDVPSHRKVRRAHPRSRGENSPKRRNSSPPRGSSPLTRGKRIAETCRKGDQGLIPAHAGKTQCGVRGPRNLRAHPRSRGENHERKPC